MLQCLQNKGDVSSLAQRVWFIALVSAALNTLLTNAKKEDMISMPSGSEVSFPPPPIFTSYCAGVGHGHRVARTAMVALRFDALTEKFL